MTARIWIPLIALAALGAAAGAVAEEPPVGGKAQSPVNLAPPALVARNTAPPLRFAYPFAISLDCVNNSEIVRCAVPPAHAFLFVDGKRWELVQFHWHTPGEHRLLGLRAPLEMHLVHQDTAGELLVVGLPFASGNFNRALAAVFQDLPRGTGDARMVPSFALASLVPADPRAFRYMGSLTTPPFSEGVRWLVLANTATASPLQIAQHLAVFPEGNSRPVQPLNGRRIETDIVR
jgi:carbonic anhydrase